MAADGVPGVSIELERGRSLIRDVNAPRPLDLDIIYYGNERFDVVVGSNLFGDILSDLGPGVTGTIAVAPSANINPERRFPSMFEPVHGSAPDIAGKGIANPIGQIWSAAMLLEHIGQPQAAKAVMAAIERVLANPDSPLTPDLGGLGTTRTLGAAIVTAMTTMA